MKKLMIAVMAVVLGVAPLASAVEANGVVTFGGSFAKLEGDVADIGIDETKFGITAGIMTAVPIAKAVAFQTGILYTQRGSEGRVDASLFYPVPPGTMVDFEIDLEYVEVPLLVKVAPEGGGPYALVGFSIGVNMSAEMTGRYMGFVDTEDMADSTEDRDIVLVLGCGFELRGGVLSAGIRYSRGLTDIEKGTGEAETRTLSVGIAFSM